MIVLKNDRFLKNLFFKDGCFQNDHFNNDHLRKKISKKIVFNESF